MSEDAGRLNSLANALETSRLAREEIENFMRAFQVPSSLLGLYPVSRKLLDLLPLMHGRDIPRRIIDAHMRIAQAISDVPDLNIEGFRVYPDADHPGAFRGLYATNPLYCVLGHNCRNSALRRQHAVLMAAFIPAYWAWEPKTEDRLYLRESAGRALRRMGDFAWRPRGAYGEKVHLPALEVALKWLPIKPTPVGEYAACMKEVIESIGILGAGEAEWNTLSSLEQVFAGVVPGTKEADRRRKGFEREGGGGIVGDFLPPLAMAFTCSPGGEDEIQVSREDAGVLGDRGVDPGQVKKPPVVELIIRPRDPVFSNRDDWLLVLANRHRCEALALDNQMFWFDVDTLGPTDVRCLLEELAERTLHDEVDEGVAYLVLALYAGLPRSEILRLRVTKAKNVDLDAGPTLRINQRLLQVRTLSAQRNMRLPKAQQENRLEHDSDLEIRLPGAVIDALEKFCGVRAIHAGGVLFSDAEETVRQSKGLLEGVNSKHGTRLTLNRVDAFRYVLMAGLKDEAAGILGTGRMTDRAYEPATYSAWSHSALDALAVRATNELGDLAGLGPAWRLRTRKEPANEATAGSRLVPTLHAVRLFVKMTKDRIDRACKGGLGLLDLVAMHNAYASYVYACLIFGLGMRPVSQPFPHQVFIDWEGWALLTDKDDDSCYHTRLVYLTETISALLRELKEHNRLLAQRLPLLAWNEAAHLLRSPIPKASRKRSANLQASATDPRLFFLLDACGERTLISPTMALAGLGEMGLENNAGRHFLRTTLRERSCPDQLVRALMGHWRIGEEPHGRFSTLDPMATRAAAKQWVEPLLAECGWAVIRSPLWRN